MDRNTVPTLQSKTSRIDETERSLPDRQDGDIADIAGAQATQVIPFDSFRGIPATPYKHFVQRHAHVQEL